MGHRRGSILDVVSLAGGWNRAKSLFFELVANNLAVVDANCVHERYSAIRGAHESTELGPECAGYLLSVDIDVVYNELPFVLA